VGGGGERNVTKGGRKRLNKETCKEKSKNVSGSKEEGGQKIIAPGGRGGGEKKKRTWQQQSNESQNKHQRARI